MKSILRPYALDVRNWHFLIIDVVMLAVLPWVALLARVEHFDEVWNLRHSLIVYTLLMLAWKPLVLYLSGIYKRYWPYASTDSLVVLIAGALSTLVIEIFIALFVAVTRMFVSQILLLVMQPVAFVPTGVRYPDPVTAFQAEGPAG